MGGGLYTPEQKKRRDETVWTLVQGVLAPLQFLVFAISAVFVINFLLNGTGLEIATASVILKTLILYSIMVTGAIWEKVVFGRYLFAPAFFWEDVVSMGVIALHTLYMLMWLTGSGSPQEQMVVALSAYGAYLVNAIQFLLKFQQARSSASGMSLQTDYNDLGYQEGARS
ncbi:MAG: 2-vinyl bacteriochlorophyllide hydratase [Gammaproteobacteria bacterium]